MTNQDITHLTQAIMDLKGQIERMAERQDEMLEDVKKIKEAVYNPDSGLYTRIRDLDERIKDIESWQANVTKILWTIATTVTGLVAATIYKLIME